MLWTFTELSAACGLEIESESESESEARCLDITGISIDSRTTRPGDLFVALAGDPGPEYNSSTSYPNARDGHEFIAAAEAAGAVAVLVSRNIESSLAGITVKNTLDGLWLIAEAARERMEGKVIGITGSSGKTTARAWLEEILSEQASTHASKGSFNNHWGVPLSLARMPAESEFGVFEIGMNHPGEIEPLSRLVKPEVALVLNVLPAHLGSFKDLEGIRREKLSIAKGLVAGGTLVVHEDIELSNIQLSDIELSDVDSQKIITFGVGISATVAGVVTYEGNDARVDVTVDGNQYVFSLQRGGEHKILTLLACLAVVYALGGDINHACRAIPSLKSPVGRGNILEVSGRVIIDDSYNANPVSMRYALESLSRFSGGKRFALLGEMLELGPEGDQMHASLIDICHTLDGVITVGEGFANASKNLGEIHLGHYDSISELDLEDLVAQLEEGDTILVKGSNKVFWVHGFVGLLEQALKRDAIN